MVRGLKSVLTLFLLAAFLFPSLVKEVHSAGHEQRIHCDAKSEKHLHVQHHNCDLCDFVQPVLPAPVNDRGNFTQVDLAAYVFPHYSEVYFSSARFSSTLLRAPPFIS